MTHVLPQLLQPCVLLPPLRPQRPSQPQQLPSQPAVLVLPSQPSQPLSTIAGGAPFQEKKLEDNDIKGGSNALVPIVYNVLSALSNRHHSHHGYVFECQRELYNMMCNKDMPKKEQGLLGIVHRFYFHSFPADVPFHVACSADKSGVRFWGHRNFIGLLLTHMEKIKAATKNASITFTNFQLLGDMVLMTLYWTMCYYYQPRQLASRLAAREQVLLQQHLCHDLPWIWLLTLYLVHQVMQLMKQGRSCPLLATNGRLLYLVCGHIAFKYFFDHTIMANEYSRNVGIPTAIILQAEARVLELLDYRLHLDKTVLLAFLKEAESKLPAEQPAKPVA